MSKSVRIECEGAATLPFSTLEEFQGDLKTLSTRNYRRLKKDILELGFSFPISIWRNGGNKIIDGHQRLRTVRQMVKEGYECPLLPVNWVEAKDEVEAKRKVLAGASQFGEMTVEGLEEQMSLADFQWPDIEANFRFPDIEIPQSDETKKVEFDAKEKKVCPHCGGEL